MLPHLYNALKTWLVNLLSRFVKPEALESDMRITELVFDEKTMLEPAKVDVGFGAKAAIRAVNSVSTQRNNKKIVKEFKVECRESMIQMTKKLLKRTPLNSS